MAASEFPTPPGGLTAAWLTQALRASVAARISSVTSFDATIIGEGTGFMGQIAHLRLRSGDGGDFVPEGFDEGVRLWDARWQEA